MFLTLEKMVLLERRAVNEFKSTVGTIVDLRSGEE